MFQWQTAFMHLRPRYLWVLAAGIAILGAVAGFWLVDPATDTENAAPLNRLPLASLERRLVTIHERLSCLATPSMRTGVGAVGYRSKAWQDSSHPEWIQITLAKPVSIDQVVLVPTIWRDTARGFRADGFPLEFSIRVGVEGESEGKVVARYRADEAVLPRVAPVVIDFPSIEASWVRLDATMLSRRGWDGMHILQLSEILIFSGNDNVALRQSVDVSSSDSSSRGFPRHKDYLVDGFVPYLMDAHDGEQSLAFVSRNCLGKTPVLIIDLRKPQPITAIHLHATELSDNIPQALSDDFGIPRSLIVQGSIDPEFKDAVTLCDYQMDSIYDAGPIIMRRFSETICRYVRLIITEPNIHFGGGGKQARVGFAEIEVLSRGTNVALDAPVSVNLEPDIATRSTTTLTDGNNLYGRILPLRVWLTELATRHDLETESPLVAAELQNRYQSQKTNVRRLSWLVGLLGFFAVCTILVERTIRQRAVFKTRERIAADLHDELGANLHAIGLLGDLAQASADSPGKLKPLLQHGTVQTCLNLKRCLAI